jgi:hypothetical protein
MATSKAAGILRSPGEAIQREVAGWPGVTVAPHQFGGVELRYGRKELGHLHGDRLADLPFPRRVRDELVTAGRAAPHHVLPESGWVSRWIAGPEDVEDVVALFRMQYERYAARAADKDPEADRR